MAIHDLDNNPVYSGVTVQWTAIVPDPGVAIEARTVLSDSDENPADGLDINFERPFSSYTPIVICSAYDTAMGVPLMAAPYNITNSKFTISLKDADGIQCLGDLQYIALVPPQNINMYQEVALIANYQTRNSDGEVGINLTRNADVILTSAQKDTFAYASAAYNNSSTKFNIGIRNDYNNTVTNAWTSWLALGFK